MGPTTSKSLSWFLYGVLTRPYKIFILNSQPSVGVEGVRVLDTGRVTVSDRTERGEHRLTGPRIDTFFMETEVST